MAEIGVEITMDMSGVGTVNTRRRRRCSPPRPATPPTMSLAGSRFGKGGDLAASTGASFEGHRKSGTLKQNTTAGPETGGRVISNGAYRARTGDLLLAKQLLSQLS